MRDTIFALASAPGRAGVAVIRVSGPAALDAVARLTGRPRPPPRKAVLRCLIDPMGGDALDEALVLTFAAPASFTGEDVAELHVHGGRAVVAAVVGALAVLPGLRPAEPGEFSRRAFENGKLDLTEAEAIADLVDAETAAQRRQALRQMDGALGRLYDGWRERLLRALAHAEADIDFPDEDLPPGLDARVAQTVEKLADELRAHLADRHRGERLRDGIAVAIVGAPNAGKSSLMNAIAGRDVAIVSERAGTTRDVIEVEIDLNGYPVALADTAGLRDAADEIESEGVRRALARASAAEIKIAVFDAAAPLDDATRELIDADTLVVANKVDLLPAKAILGPKLESLGALAVSARDGAGIRDLLARLGDMVEARYAPTGAPSLTRARHRQALEEAEAALSRALTAPEAELAAEDLRLAMRALGRITGKVDVEMLLDVIFADFCIGK